MSAEISTFNFAAEKAADNATDPATTPEISDKELAVNNLYERHSAWMREKFTYRTAFNAGRALSDYATAHGIERQLGHKLWMGTPRFAKTKTRHTDVIRGLLDIFIEGPQPENVAYCTWLNTDHFTGCVQSIRNERDRQIQEHIDIKALENRTEEETIEWSLPKLKVRLELIMERLAKIEEAQEQNQNELRNRISILNGKLVTVIHCVERLDGKGAKGDNDQTAG